MTDTHRQELDRIRREYERRAREIPSDFYALDRPANLYLRHSQERVLRAGLASAELLPLGDRRILEVGSGNGQWLDSFLRLGSRPDRLAAIDLDVSAIERCRPRFPGADLRAGDASHLPWDDRSFAVVFQSTVFSSVLDPDFQAAIAAEMRRVLLPGGAIVWYDFTYDNPRNKSVRGIDRREIKKLFPGATYEFSRTTLAPPIARRLVPVSWTLALLLETLGVLNTHCLAVIRP